MEKKDTKGRNLRQNEDQLKDGRYRYRYLDRYGARQSVYAWRLVKTDKTPPGKREDISLREKEKQITKDIEDGIRTCDTTMTVCELLQRYLDTKARLKIATKNNYEHLIEKHIKPHDFGKKKICDVRKSDIKRFYSHLYKDCELSVGTIQLYQNILFPAFQLAVEDSIIRLNPCSGCMKDYIRGSTNTKQPLTRKEQHILLEYTKSSTVYSKYYVMIAFMLSTGCRISETLGLTWDDIDFEEKCVEINHQIIYKKKDGRCQYYASPPKNDTSRIIPLKEDILALLKEHSDETKDISKSNSFSVDGYTGFVFLNRQLLPYKSNSIRLVFKEIQTSYNKKIQEEDVDDLILLPNLSPHILRHTFCTRMAENGIDVKVLQEIMGHKTIAITMQVYNHATKERVKRAMDNTNSVLEFNPI